MKFGLQSFPIGLVMFLALCGWWIVEQRRTEKCHSGSSAFLIAVWLLLVLYALSYGSLPPLGSQVLAALILASSLLSAFPMELARKRVAYLALFPLTLPLETALQFVIGFPFRRISAEVAGGLLAPYGLSVEGTTLLYDSHALEVDAACSGVMGMWAFLIVGAILSMTMQHRWHQLLLTLTAAGVASLGYNVLRTSLLFMYRFHSGVESTFMHSLLGAVAFIIAMSVFAFFAAHKLRSSTRVGEEYAVV